MDNLNFMYQLRNSRGFTLVELLIVIAIIAIIASVVFVALDPLKRFRDARDSSRWRDISAVLNAIKIDQVDNGGSYMSEVANMNNNEYYMIVGGVMNSGCDDNNANCDVAVTGDGHCVNLYNLVTEGYLGSVPVSPATGSTVAWDKGTVNGNEGTGYVLRKDDSGILKIYACESENSDSIMATR